MTGTTLISVLIDSLNDKNSQVRSKAKNSLVACGVSAVEPLITVLSTGTPRQAADAICVLGKIGDPRAIEPLINMLNAPNLLFRMNAAEALGGLQTPRVVEALLSAVSVAEESEAVQTWSLSSLGKIGDQKAVLPLIAFLKETSSPQLRYMTIKALGQLQDQRAIEAIVPFLKDADHHVRDYARDALINLGYGDIAQEDEAW